MSVLVFHAAPGFDALTGLPDRAAFVAALKRAAESGEGVAVLFLDLDDFKVVNDGFGHEAGDRLLIQVAQRLRGAVREEDLVARLGGDEFTVLCLGVDDQTLATVTAGRLRAALAQPFDVAGQRRHVRVSIGARVAAPGEADPEALLRDADSAMYQAKEAGKDRVELFSDATRARILRRIEIETQLRMALETETLAVHYQPQLDLANGRLVGVEALVRWSEASPAEFIPVAEETGLIGPLGAWVLRTAVRDLAVWHAQGLTPLTVTVNVSTRQLEDPDFPDVVAHGARRRGHRARGAVPGADRVRADGRRHRLARLPARDQGPRRLRRDRRLRHRPLLARPAAVAARRGAQGRPLVRRRPRHRAGDSAVVAAVLSLAHALGLHVIAEGVETPLQANQLVALGCPVAQGFLWSPAVPAAQIPGDGGARHRRRTRAPAATAASAAWSIEMMHQIGIAKEGLK